MRRRGSLVGPLLIILIGVWFLMSSLRPDLPLLDLAARFWPFVLIGWGALRTIEILSWAAKGRPLPVAGVSGGEWVLIVFLCLAGSGLYAVNQYRPWQHLGVFTANRVEWLGESYDYTIAEQKAPAPKSPRVLLENLYGNARIVGSDAAEIRVSGHKTVRALREQDASAANNKTPVEVSNDGAQIVVRTNEDRVTGDVKITADLEIAVPKTATIEVRGRNGDIEISDVDGSVDGSSDNASVRLQNIGAAVRLDLRKTDLVRAIGLKSKFDLLGGRGRDIELDTIDGEVTINGSYSGDVQLRKLAKTFRLQSPERDLNFEKLPGQIHMDRGELVGANIVGPVRLTSSRSYDVQMEQFSNALEVNVERGDLTLRPAQSPLPKIDARTHIGQIELSLPPAGQFELKATTSRGELNNEFGPPLKVDYEEGNRHHNSGAIAAVVGHGPSMTLTTDRGSITIRKDTGVSIANLGPSVPHPPQAPDLPEIPKPPSPPPMPDLTPERQ